MFSAQDLINLKTENEKRIAENDALICEKQAENVELAAENRVFDKIINMFPAECVASECIETNAELNTIEN